MNHKKILAVFLAIFLAGAIFAFAATPAAAQTGDINVSVSPQDGEVGATGDVQNYSIMVENATDGIGAFELNVSVGDTTVGEIDSYALAVPVNESGNGAYDNSAISAGNSSLNLSAALGNESIANQSVGASVPIAYVDVNATGSDGDSTNVTVGSIDPGFEVAVPTVGQGSNPPQSDYYNVSSFNNGTFSIVAGNVSLNAAVKPGIAQNTNNFTLTSNVSQSNNATSVQEIWVDFGGSGVTPSNIAAGQVGVTTDGTAASVSSVSADSGGLLINLSNSFTLGSVNGNVVVTVDNANVPNNGSYTATLEYQDGSGGVVASASDGYVIAVAGSVDIQVRPTNFELGEGQDGVYEIVVVNANTGIGEYEFNVTINDPAVAEFTGFYETYNDNAGSQALSQSSLANGNSTLALSAALNDQSFSGASEIVIAEVNVSALGVAGDSTGVTPMDITGITNETGTFYSNTPGSASTLNLISPFNMSLDFNKQDLAADDTVTVENVSTDGISASILVTYGPQNTIAGIQNNVVSSGDDVAVTIDDKGGFPGDHTAHILPMANVSGQSAVVGNNVSAATAGNILDSATANITEAQIPALDGLDIEITNGFTVGDDYPVNVREIQTGVVYQPSTEVLPGSRNTTWPEHDERFTPILQGQHTGIVGLPIQDEVYDWIPRDNYTMNDANLSTFSNATQTIAISMDADSDEELTLNFEEATDHGLELADYSLVDFANINTTYFSNPADNITVGSSSLTIDVHENVTGSPTFQFQLVWTAEDPVEGLNVDRPNDIDFETDHRVIDEAGNQERANFVVFEVGATGISYEDRVAGSNNGFLNESVQQVELASNVDAPGAASGTANPGSFLVWQNERVTFETQALGDTINVYETDTRQNSQDEEVYSLGPQVSDDVLGFDDTEPGLVANLNTSNLTAGQTYFVTFGTDQRNAVVLDVRPLNLGAEAESDSIPFSEMDEPFEIDVTSDDSTPNSNIEAWIRPEGSDAVSDVVHVEREELTGSGDRTVEIIPGLDINDSGDYYATILHTESEVTTRTDTFSVGSEVDFEGEMIIESPTLQSDIAARGDIVEINVRFVEGSTGTLTFGNREMDESNVEINVTLQDTDLDGEGTVYVNTYQIGQGLVMNQSDVDGYSNNTAPWIADDPSRNFVNRNHGFFTLPNDGDGTAIRGPVLAHPNIDIYGGSQGGAVLHNLRYDLYSIGGTVPFTASPAPPDSVNVVDILDRSTDAFNVYTAPGVGTAAPTLDNVEDIQAAMENGQLTEVEIEETDDGWEFTEPVAEDDLFIVEHQASGIEGAIHEAVLRNSTLTTQDFMQTLFNEGDIKPEFYHALSESTLSAGPNSGWVVPSIFDFRMTATETDESLETRRENLPPNVAGEQPARVELDLAPHLQSVIAERGANELTNGSLRALWTPVQFTNDTDLLDPFDAPNDFMAPYLELDFHFELEPNFGAQNFEPGTRYAEEHVPVNTPLRSEEFPVHNETDNLDYINFSVTIEDLNDGVLEVPRQPNVSVNGTSTGAPGTTLQVDMITQTGQDTPFVKRFEDVPTYDQPGMEPAHWGVVADFTETTRAPQSTDPDEQIPIQGGTTFTTEVRRVGVPGVALSVPGIVLPDPEIDQFEFSDQRSNGQAVVIDSFQANRDTMIELQNADGEVLGQSDVLERDTLHEVFAVAFDENLTSNQEITAVARVAGTGDAYPDGARTAEVTVEEEVPPQIRFSNLQPLEASVVSGDVISSVSADVENIGDSAKDFTIILQIRDASSGTEVAEVATQTVTLEGGAQDVVTFENVDTSALDTGEYEHRIYDAEEDHDIVGTLNVEPASELEISGFSGVTATVNDSASVSATIENTGGSEATQTVTLSVGGEEMTQEVTVAGGSSQSVSFSVDTSGMETGDVDMTLSTDDDEASATLTVEEDTSGNGTEDGDSDGSGPGFGIAVAALALLGAALVAMRRRVE